MKEKFIKFLKENNALEAFERNLKDFKKITIDDYLNSHDKEGYIDTAFAWSDTDEGGAYWKHIQEMWSHEIRSYKYMIVGNGNIIHAQNMDEDGATTTLAKLKEMWQDDEINFKILKYTEL